MFGALQKLLGLDHLGVTKGGHDAQGYPHPQQLNVQPTQNQLGFNGMNTQSPQANIGTNQQVWAGGSSPLQIGMNPDDLDLQPGGGYLQYGRTPQPQVSNFSNPIQGAQAYPESANINQRPQILQDLLKRRF